MYNFILSNVYKGIKSKTVWMLMMISTCGAMLTTFLANGIAMGKINASLVSMVFLFSDTSMLAILGAVLAATLIGAEFDNKLFHHAIVAGYSRLQIVIGKSVTYWVLFIALIVPYFIVNVLAVLFDWHLQLGMAGAGFLNIVNATDVEKASQFTALFVMAGIYIAQFSLTILLAFAVKKAMLIIPLFYVVSALSGQVSLYAQNMPTFNTILNATPFGSDFIALTPHNIDELLLPAIGVSIVFMIVIVAITFVTFRKAELK